MNFVGIDAPEAGIARITFERPPVNAINMATIVQLQSALEDVAGDDSVKSVILTGHGSFFSFGLDVPEIYPLSPAEFMDFLRAFTGLYRALFASPKPIIAALNGHATAGGCMLAIACDRRVMAHGKAKIGLNEVRFGAGLFAGISLMLERLVGGPAADRIGQIGAFYDAQQAQAVGLVDVACSANEVDSKAIELAREYGVCNPTALRQIRQTMRAPILKQIDTFEEESLQTFVDLWYAPETRAQVEQIVIRKNS